MDSAIEKIDALAAIAAGGIDARPPVAARFRHRIEAIVEKFTEMQADLKRERATMTRLWAKREEQLDGVLDSTAGLYGDLQGIAGSAMPEIDRLDMPMIEVKMHTPAMTSGSSIILPTASALPAK